MVVLAEKKLVVLLEEEKSNGEKNGVDDESVAWTHRVGHTSKVALR